jgi:hypothetical protein
MVYGEESLVLHNWPKIERESDGLWVRSWSIVFQHEIQDFVDLKIASNYLSYEGYKVDVSRVHCNELEFSVKTKDSYRDEDYLIFNAFKMLEEIDILFRGIDTIQGQSCEEWNPWLTRVNHPDLPYILKRNIIKSLEVGLRLDRGGQVSFFGINEANEIIFGVDSKVISLEPGGIITQEKDDAQFGEASFSINGFMLVVHVFQQDQGITLENCQPLIESLNNLSN